VATAVITRSQELQTEEQLTVQYATGLIYRALIEAGEPLKASEVAKAVGRADVDTKLARVVLSTNPHMTAVDRKWTLWTRYLDTRSTVDQNLRRILEAFGQPVRILHLAREMNVIYGRPEEVYEEMLARLAAENTRYFRVGEDYIAPVDWLLTTESEEESEILFDNFLEDDDVFPFVKAAAKSGLSASEPQTILALLDSVGKPLRNKALQFLAWQRAKESFDAAAFYGQVFLESGAQLLSGGSWIGPKLAQTLASRFPALAEQEVSDNAEAEAQEAAQPLTIGDPEREQLAQAVLDSENTVYATRLLEDIFEVTPDYRTYAEDLQTIVHALRNDDRIVWVGGDRFRPQGTIPSYVFTVPGLLEIPEYHFTDVEGNPVDQLLEDDGFDGGLEREIMNPLAQDVLDEEPVPLPDPNPPSNARAVIKYHHKQIGTLPLCQFSSGFFPPEPSILETEFTLPGGQKAQVWVNNETRLLYGLLDWFQSIPIDSGATFTLERQAADRYTINYNDESEPTMFISRNRVNELIALQERAEAEELATFEIMREIMEHYRKGIEYLTLHTEVNIVRRVTRRLVASILSEYHCFFQRGGAWVYDAKKLAQGFDKSKRKYLVK
jgi:hypothetical protein